MNINKYLKLMADIKRRDRAIVDILKLSTTTSYPATNVEFIYLQIRRILELIAFASLIANERHFKDAKKKYKKLWHAGEILKYIESIDPKFYPEPINSKQSSDANINYEWEKVKNHLTQKDFISLYGRCGDILHEPNPFRQELNYEKIRQEIYTHLTKIRGLLSEHIIKANNSGTEIYNIQMNPFDKPVKYTTFGLLKKLKKS